MSISLTQHPCCDFLPKIKPYIAAIKFINKFIKRPRPIGLLTFLNEGRGIHSMKQKDASTNKIA